MTRQQHIQACVELLESEVQSKKGLSGFALRGAYQTLCALKPNATYRLIDTLWDDFWVEYQDKSHDSSSLATAWLEIVDQRAQKHSKTKLHRAYQVLRPSAHQHVESAIPKFVQLFDQLGTLGTSTKFR